MRWVSRREQRDHRAARLVDDLGDQLERMLRAQAEPDERDVRMLSRGHLSDFPDVDLARDDLVPESGDDLREQVEPVSSLVRDQDTQRRGHFAVHRPRARGQETNDFSSLGATLFLRGP